MVQHMVMWSFKEEENIDEILIKLQKMFKGFKHEVPGLESLEIYKGFNGYDACLISLHKDEKALEQYQKYPQHLEVRSFMKTVVDKRAAIDFIVIK